MLVSYRPLASRRLWALTHELRGVVVYGQTLVVAQTHPDAAPIENQRSELSKEQLLHFLCFLNKRYAAATMKTLNLLVAIATLRGVPAPQMATEQDLDIDRRRPRTLVEDLVYWLGVVQYVLILAGPVMVLARRRRL